MWALYIGLTPIGWDNMVRNWYDKLIAIVALIGVVLGLVWLVYVVVEQVRKQQKKRRDAPSKITPNVTQCFDDLKIKSTALRHQKPSTPEPKSFGVFLGSFANPPTPTQTHLLSQWELIVLDPLQAGVLEALATPSESTQILGRLNVEEILKLENGVGADEETKALGVVAATIATAFKMQHAEWSPFTGVLLANWRTRFNPMVCNELISFLNGLNLDVYLELSAPDYLTSRECSDMNFGPIRGVVCRNGTIFPNGERRDYYQMKSMRNAQRALAKHASMGGHTFIMWETIDDDVELKHAEVKRSYNWCRFNTTISWIGPKAALYDAETAAARTLPGEPLGALMWLKSHEVMELQEIWRTNDRISQEPCNADSFYDSLQRFIPGLGNKLSFTPDKKGRRTSRVQRQAVVLGDMDWPLDGNENRPNPFTYASSGRDYTGLGCFQLGLDGLSNDFEELVEGQRRLRDLGMLDRIKPEELQLLADKLRVLYESRNPWTTTPGNSRAIKELILLIDGATGDDNDLLRVHMGLHSGFRKRLDVQFWGLYDVDPVTGVTDIYFSRNNGDRTGTILHTFLSSKRLSRAECLMAELALAEENNALNEKWDLPPRIVKDIEQLSPTELIPFLQRLVSSDSGDANSLSTKLKALCEYQLIDVPSLAQLKALNTSAYLRGEISADDLIKSRIAWHREQGCSALDTTAATAVFKEMDLRLPIALMSQEAQRLEDLVAVLQQVLKKDKIDASADIFALSVFCAFRKLAVDEVYLEVLDRNPLPNRHSDQAACFAEMFATGSQCLAYFDMTSNVLGRILADRYQAYYMQHQPPHRDDLSTDLPTAYASKLVDEDPNAGVATTPIAYQITFLGLFAVPALVDILLLTILGRGLYLSTYMNKIETTFATAGLMVGLLTCGAIGTWIGNGGSYYLHAMAFPAMNMFVLTRFVAGIALWLSIGITALIGIGIAKGFYAGFIFFFYFNTLAMYLTLLATLSIYQLPGFTFQSGRTTVVACIPILFISPILSLWVHDHDIVIYTCVITGFIISLIYGARRVLAQWSDWYLRIPTLSDTELVNWYTASVTADGSALVLPEGVSDLAATPLPRKALNAAIQKERTRKFWNKPTSDELVLRLVKGYDATMFLMDWYCKYSRTKMPYAFSPTFNLQVKAAVDTLKDMQKGLKLHNAFIHWRYGGDEVWCGVLYFVIALMDKWVALLTGGSLVGLSAANSPNFRLPVGFSLAYYLLAAVCLDSVAHPLWARANKKTDQPIASLGFLRDAAINDGKARRGLYWKNFLKFFFMHLWGLGATAALLWTFEEGRSAIIMYMAYVGAYTGLLWYQYNRIYTGPLAMGDLLTAATFGFLLGPLMHRLKPDFEYSGVLALGAATWTAALLSIRTADIGWPGLKRSKTAGKETNPVLYSCGSSGPAPTQRTLTDIYNATCALPAEDRHVLTPSAHPGVQIMKNLMSAHVSEKQGIVQAAFLDGDGLLHRAADLWRSGTLVVELAPMRHPFGAETQLRSISRTHGEQVHVIVFVGLTSKGQDWAMDVARNCKIVAEAMVQATAKAAFGFSHDHSTLAEVLINEEGAELAIPEGTKRQLESSRSERARVIKTGEQDWLRYLLLGLDCDREWDNLPQSTRLFLLKRCCGDTQEFTEANLRWIHSRFQTDGFLDVHEHVARCNLGAALASLITNHASALQAEHVKTDLEEPLVSAYQKLVSPSWSEEESGGSILERIKRPAIRVLHSIRFAIKFFVVSLVADPEFQRELNYVIASKSIFVRWPARFVLNGVWIYCHTLQQIIIPWFLFYNRKNVTSLYENMKGIKTVVEKNRVIIDSLDGTSTGFFKAQPDGSAQFSQYSGIHDSQPEGNGQLMAINTYNGKFILQKREEYGGQSLVRAFEYQYPANGKSKLPTARRCVKGNPEGQIAQYDERGYIVSGSYIRDDNDVDFKFYYRKHAKFDDELLRAKFEFAHIQMRVAWCVPPPKHADKIDSWIPNPKVTEVTFTAEDEVYRSVWDYDHRSHPIITTTLNGQLCDTPPMIEFDWFGILSKPKNCSFLADNPLFSFGSMNASIFSRALGLNKRWYPVSTSLARTHLWKTWKGSKDFDGIITRWLDEKALRSDKVLAPYWRNRDFGHLKAAKEYLDQQADAIMARTDVNPDISSWSSLAYKFSDLLSFGQGGDTRINTRTSSSLIRDNHDTLHVLAMDTGTWPIEGGGVSACRRDMVNDLKTIRWHVVAEAANDYGTPKFQIERNVQSLSILPLWGLDFLTPTHGVFQDSLDSAVQQKSFATTNADIEKNFFPILTSLVKCARAVRFDIEHVEEATRALVDLNAYFEHSRHWSKVWMSDIVKQKWRELWLDENMENTVPISQWWDAECPTLKHFDNALDMWHRYLFIFSLPVPEKIPDIFQASHHFAGASYGVLCKALRNCSFHVWDHCISWREVTVFLSSAMSFDAPFVCTALVRLSRVTSTLILHHADVVLPCADFFNPDWEVEHGTQEGVLQHRHAFRRKIDPVVNGICNMDTFKPIEKIKTARPTVTMLSHVRFVKDIKNALLAADIIVHEWGFKEYQLDIYGDMEKAPAYSVECKEILAAKGLREHVALKGLGKPSKVLEDAWLFLNSSISEGLPLAMGEAALTGVPVVCTDVGASFRVVTDPVTWKKFSAVVAPNDAYSLAKAQVNVLGLLDEWSEYADDPPGERIKMSLHPTPAEVAAITQRMHDKTPQRRKLGMLGRANVLSSFSSDRYLREHEQLLWIGKFHSPSYLARSPMVGANGLSLKYERGSGRSSGFGHRSGYSTPNSEYYGRITPSGIGIGLPRSGWSTPGSIAGEGFRRPGWSTPGSIAGEPLRRPMAMRTPSPMFSSEIPLLRVTTPAQQV